MLNSGSELATHKLEKLIDHGRKAVWDPKGDVDWSEGGASLDSLDRAKREALRSVLSLVYYSDSQGQLILEALCRALDRKGALRGAADVKLLESAREFFELQIGDENRHAEGLRLLFGRLGLEPEEQSLSHALYSKVLLAEGLFDVKLILIYWYIEVLAKGIFVELKRRFPASPVDSLFTRIIRDEARHVGFGEVFIPEQARSGARPGLGVAYYTSAAAVPLLYRFTRYARAARELGLDVGSMFREGMSEISAKSRKLPATQGLLDLSRPSAWVATLL